MHPQSTCSVADCDRPSLARSFCNLHYKRWLRKGNTDLLPPRETKPLVEIICACGCSEAFFARFRPSRPQAYIKGHFSRLPRKSVVKTIPPRRRIALYTAADNRCEQCGLPMDEQVKRYGRRLEIHHKNHDHADNSPGNHEVLCTGCHNRESLSVRDEIKKSQTWHERYEAGEIRMWGTGLTKETDPRVAAMAEKKRGISPKIARS